MIDFNATCNYRIPDEVFFDSYRDVILIDRAADIKFSLPIPL